MGKLFRNAAAVIIGFFAASVVMMIVESINGRVLYPELGKAVQGVTDREQLRSFLASAPAGALLVVLLGWLLGSFAGGFVTARIAGSSPMKHAIILGVLLTLAGILNNLMLPPPVWFWLPTLIVFLPAAYAGARLVPARSIS